VPAPPTNPRPTAGPDAAAVPGERPPRWPRVRARAEREAHWAVALLIFLVIAVVVTWPLAKEPTGVIYGFPGDSTGQITLTEYRADLGVGPLSMRRTPDENAPFGLPLPGATSLPQVAVEGPLQALRWVSGDSVLSYNIMVLLGLLLTPLAAYLLCRRVTGSWWAGLIGGLAYGFNPWHLEKAQGHLHFTHVETLPLIVLALILLRQGAGRRAWILLAVTTVLALYTHTYFALFVGAILAAFLIADIGGAFLSRSRAALRRAVIRGALAVGIAVAAMVPQGLWLWHYGSAIDRALEGTRNAESDLYVYGSRWFEWLVPSFRNPIFDTWTNPYRVAHLHGSNLGETSIYIGGVIIVLALAGAAIAIARRRAERRAGWIAAFGGALVIVGLLTSLPKTVRPLGVEFPTPAWFVSHLFDSWRVYSRLFSVVEIGAVLLAALAVAALARALPRIAAPLCLTPLAALVVADLSISSGTFPTAAPPIYEVVADAPGEGARVEYPLAAPASAEHLLYIFRTEAARRPLMNGGKPMTPGGSFSGRLSDLGKPWVPRTLASLDVRYAIVHLGLYPGNVAPTPAAGMRFVARRGPDLLYRVTARPAPIVAVPGANFLGVEQNSVGRYEQWLGAQDGTIAVLNRTGAPKTVEMRTAFWNFHRPRTVTIRQGERVLLRKPVPLSTPVSFRVTAPPGLSELEVHTSRPPDRIGDVLNNDDYREVTVRMAGIEIRGPGLRPFQVG
jgi:hypothetical protein